MGASRKFHCETDAYLFLEDLVWSGQPRCPTCGEDTRLGRLQGHSTAAGVWKCYRCRKPFSVRAGTAFHNSHVPLCVWLQALYLMAGSRGEISVHALAEILAVSQKTAWHLKKKIASNLEGFEPCTAQAAAAALEVEVEEADLDLAPHEAQPGEPHLNGNRYKRFRQAAGAIDIPETRHLFMVGLLGLLGRRPPAVPEVGEQLEFLLFEADEDDDGEEGRPRSSVSPAPGTAAPSRDDPRSTGDGLAARLPPRRPFPDHHRNTRHRMTGSAHI